MIAKVPGIIASALVATVVAGCAHTPPPPCDKPETLRVVIKAGKNLNPGEDGQPLPTLVRVYVLRNAQALEAASADEMQRSDRDIVGSDVIEQREITLKPASYEKMRFERTRGSVYVAAVAFVRDPQGNGWRAVKRVPPEDENHCRHGKSGETGPGFDFLIDSNRVEAR